jgi:MscS family membrane protein
MTDAGVLLFDVADPRAVKNAEVAVLKASDGLREAMPQALVRPALGLELWQWLGMPVVLALVAVLTVAASSLSTLLLGRVLRRASGARFVAALRSPIRLWWFSLLARLGLQLLGLPEGLEAGLIHGGRIGIGISFFWGVVRAVSVWADGFLTSSWASSRPGSRALVNLVTRIAKFALVALGILATLSELGYSVTSVLAGLGLGGLAIALGAQKTLENVFGAFALAVDQPFREGDYVTVETISGTVERIGLRSTRIRTLERTVVTIPNGKLADLRLESYAPREHIRLQLTLRLALTSASASLKALRAAIEARLAADPKLVKGSLTVRFGKLAECWLELDLGAYLDTTDAEEFRRLREAILLDVLDLIEKNGVRLFQPPALSGAAEPSGPAAPKP